MMLSRASSCCITTTLIWSTIGLVDQPQMVSTSSSYSKAIPSLTLASYVNNLAFQEPLQLGLCMTSRGLAFCKEEMLASSAIAYICTSHT